MNIEEIETNDRKNRFRKNHLRYRIQNKNYIEEPPTDLELKPLPKYLVYAFLKGTSLLPVIISSELSEENKADLLTVLKNHK